MDQASRIPMVDLARSVNEEIDQISEILVKTLASGTYLAGPQVQEFRSNFADYLGVKEVLCVGNGTNALEIIMTHLKQVGRQTMAVSANAGGYATGAAVRSGLNVRFIDVSPETALLELNCIIEAYSKKPFDILVFTHLYGNTTELEPIVDFCQEANIVLVEDCAQAAGLRVNGKMAGSFGAFAAFSFYPTKNLGACGDAGAIVCSSTDLPQVSSLSQYGWSSRYSVDKSMGTNSRMDEIQAALLSQKLQNLDNRNRKRVQIIQKYEEALNPLNGFFIKTKHTVAHLAVIKASNRKALQNLLRKQGIDSAIHYPILDSSQRAWKGKFENEFLPNSELLAKNVLSIPLFPEMLPWEIDHVCNTLTEIA